MTGSLHHFGLVIRQVLFIDLAWLYGRLSPPTLAWLYGRFSSLNWLGYKAGSLHRPGLVKWQVLFIDLAWLYGKFSSSPWFGYMIIIIIIMIIFKCYFSKEHIDLSYKKLCEHRIRKNQQVNSTVHDGKSYLK